MKTLLLIDANSIIHRCFHALPPLGSEARPTQALYGLASVLIRLYREDKPEYAAALFDRPEPTFRAAKYAEYKAHRPETPASLSIQLRSAQDLFLAFGIRPFEAAGWEADDLIATLARRFGDEPEVRTVILTGDLDTLQLVRGDRVVVRTFRKGISDTFIYDEAAVRERYGLSPAQIVDYKALVGDASDNIKGLPGVGPKTAAALLAAHGTVEGVLAAAVKDPKLGAKIGPHAGLAALSKELVTLRTYDDLPVAAIDELGVDFDQEKAAALFRELGFDTLLTRLRGEEAKPKPPKEPPAPKDSQGQMFG